MSETPRAEPETSYLEATHLDGDGVALTGDRVVLGRAAGCEVVIAFDPAVSRIHACLDRLGGEWVLSDLGSRNGTYLNGVRVDGMLRLRPDDEIRVGSTRMWLRAPPGECGARQTDAALPSPQLTARQRDVLTAMIRPVIDGGLELATVRDIGSELSITAAAVHQHLAVLYAKFGITGNDRARRARLANEAVRRGAVTAADVRATLRPPP